MKLWTILSIFGLLLLEKLVWSHHHYALNHVFVPRGSIKCPEDSESYGYCVKVETYPLERIQTLLNNSSYSQSPCNSLITREIEPNPSPMESLSRSIGSSTKVCPVRGQYVKPEAAKNENGDWRYVINTDKSEEGLIQQVWSETCLNGDGSACLGSCGREGGYRAVCKQEYLRRRLLSLSPGGNQLVMENFLFPNGCSCHLE